MIDAQERTRRWRLILGGSQKEDALLRLAGRDAEIDRALAALYGGDRDPSLGRTAKSRRGGAGESAPTVARWLGDIRKYFPSTVVSIMQRDALERLNLKQMLMEKEMLEAVEADVHLVSEILSLNRVIPEQTRETARAVVRKVVDELMKRLEQHTRSAILGSLNRAARTNRPRHNDIDWPRTIRANLKHYQPEYNSIIPERLIGYGRKQTQTLRDVILCVDQSGSMATSVVYSSIFGAVMASIRAVKTHMVVFDTSVVDLTADLADPVDLLFGTQLGGGTDINRALAYCEGLVRVPSDTILILISDLCEGGNAPAMLKRVGALVESGVKVIALLALSDDGAPSFDGNNAQELGALDVPCFAGTPDLFPDLMAAAIQKKDLKRWVAEQGISSARGRED